MTSRRIEIVRAARELLEHGGPAALTMRGLADQLQIKAPSLYKHLPDKGALELAIVVDGFEQAALAFEDAVLDAEDPLAAFVSAYRAFVADHPHVYRLMTEGPLPRDDLPPGLEERTAAPLVQATGDPARARAAFGFIHGMVSLEMNGRFPNDGNTEAAWARGLEAFRAPSVATELLT